MTSEFYIYALGALTLITSATPMGFIGCLLILLLTAYGMAFAENGKPALVGFCFLIFPFNNATLEHYMMPMIYAAILPIVLLIVAFVYRLTAIKKQNGKLIFGDLWLGLVILPLVFAFSGIFTHFNVMIMLGSLAFGAFFFGYYIIVTNSMRFNFKEYMAKLVVGVGLTVMLQLVWYYFTNDFWYVVDNKAIFVGWGNSNCIGIVCSFAIPMAMYLALKRERTIVYTVLAAMLLVAACFTFSRGSLLLDAIIVPCLMIYSYVKTENRRAYLLTLGGIFIVVCTLVGVFLPTFKAIFDNMFNIGFSDRGRIALYSKAVADFLANPIFGVGMIRETTGNNPLILTHCTPLQLLQSCGIIGLLFGSVYFFQRYLNLFRNFSLFKLFALASVLLYDGYGLMEISIMQVYCYFMVYGLAVACSNEKSPTPAFASYRAEKNEAVSGVALAV